MRIETPVDYDYSQMRTLNGNFKIPPTLTIDSNPKKKKSRRVGLKAPKTQPNKKHQPNYFDLMNKQVKIKTYINLFVRKLKQSSILNRNIQHQLLESQNQQNLHLTKTISLNTNFQIAFTILDVIQTIFACIITSMAIAFTEIRNSSVINYLSLLTSLFCLAKIIIRFTTKSTIDVKNENKSYEYIRDAIIQGFDRWTFMDICITIIFFLDFACGFQLLVYFKMIILAKVGSCMKNITDLEILLISNCFREQYWALVKVFIFNYIFAHFLAIVLLLMANTQNSWLVQKKLIDNPWHQQYIWSYYWATTIMLTVGFGDIVPHNSQEALIMIFIQSLSCIVLAYNINSVGGIIRKITSYEQQKISNFKTFTQMQGKENISQDIKDKITNYITQSAQLKRNFNVEQEKKLIEKLPNSFYQQFKKQSNLHIFGFVPFFRNLCVDKLRDIALKIDKKLAHPQQIIVQSNTVPDIYVVNNGHIAYSLNRIGYKCHGKQVQSFKASPGQFKILSLYFFINKEINYDIKCKDCAIVYSLERKQLQSILSSNSSSYEYYCTIRDKDRFNPNDWQVQKCDVCAQQCHHTIFQCPQLHYIPIKQLVITKLAAKYPEKLRRNTIRQNLRKEDPTLCPLRHKNELAQACLQFNSVTSMNQVSVLSRKIQKGLTCKLTQLDQDQNEIDELMTKQWGIISKKQSKSVVPNTTYPMNQNFDIIFREVGDKLKTQIIKTANFGLQEIQLDVAHNYISYFHKYNPSEVGSRYNAIKASKK